MKMLPQKYLELSKDIPLFSMPCSARIRGTSLHSLTCFSCVVLLTEDWWSLRNCQSRGTSTMEKEQIKFQKWNRIKVSTRWKPGIAFLKINYFGQLWCVLTELLAVKISMHLKMYKYIWIFCAAKTGIHNFPWNTEQREKNEGVIHN